MDKSWLPLLELLDKHPSVFVVVIVVVFGLLMVFGLPLPKRTQRQTADGVETTWSLDGGIPGIGPGLVSLGKAIVKSSETNATEREANRTAHATELQAHKTELELIRREQTRFNDELSKLGQSIYTIATDMHAAVDMVKQLLTKRAADESPVQSTDRASAASCAPLPKH